MYSSSHYLFFLKKYIKEDTLKFKSLSKFLLLSLVLSLLASCTAVRILKSTKLKEPTFKFVDHKIEKVRSKKTVVHLSFDAYNPNEVGLRNVYLSYELFTKEKRFLKGKNIKINLVPKGTTQVVVPAEIVYKDVFRALRPVAEKILLKHKTLPVKVKVKMHGRPTVYNKVEEGALFSFNLNLNTTIDVPIPHDEIDAAVNKAAKKAKKKLDKLKKFF